MGTDGEFTTNHFGIYQDIMRHTPTWPTLGNHEAVEFSDSWDRAVLRGPCLADGVLWVPRRITPLITPMSTFIVLDSMSSGREVTDPMLTMAGGRFKFDKSGMGDRLLSTIPHIPKAHMIPTTLQTPVVGIRICGKKPSVFWRQVEWTSS